jgi:hypothetical protein
MKKIETFGERAWFTKLIKTVIREKKVKGRKKQILLYCDTDDGWQSHRRYVDWSDTNYTIGSKKPSWVDGDGIVFDVNFHYDGNENALTRYAHSLIDKYNSSL